MVIRVEALEGLEDLIRDRPFLLKIRTGGELDPRSRSCRRWRGKLDATEAIVALRSQGDRVAI